MGTQYSVQITEAQTLRPRSYTQSVSQKNVPHGFDSRRLHHLRSY